MQLRRGKLKAMEAVLDRQEQYSRRKCVLIPGIDGVEGEDTEEHRNQKIKSEDIDRSH